LSMQNCWTLIRDKRIALEPEFEAVHASLMQNVY
jgi:hypothetical protein